MRRALFALTLLCTLPARAQEAPPNDAAVTEARKHFAEGQRLFDKGDLKAAVEELKEAYRLSKNPLLLYNIAFIYDKIPDEALALHYYTKFIDEQKDTDRTHGQLQEAGVRATALRAKLGIEQPKPPPTTQPAVPHELMHAPIDEAPPGKPIDVVASIPRDVAWTVTLHYRAPGVDLFQGAQMKPLTAGRDVTELVARIPAGALRSTALQYYVAARDPDGKLVASSGRAQTPHIIYLDPKAKPHIVLPEDAEAGPLPPLPPPPPRVPDRPTRPLTYVKWAVSGASLALLGTSVALGISARDHAETLQGEAIKSQMGSCTDGPPCITYTAPFKELESRGKSLERWANITLVAGAVAAATAGVFWYLDARAAAAIVPVAGPGTIGASATVRF